MSKSSSIAYQQRFYQAGTALRRLLDEAPYLPRCSDNKTAVIARPRQYAIRYPYMQVNRPGMVSWLVFDLDHSNPMIWDDEDLPAPNIVVVNPKNGHAHLFYAIPPVCTSENARSRPIAYMRAVYEAMAARLGSDPSYSGPVAKTPGHPWWNTWEIHNKVYDLGELAEYVDLALKPRWSNGPNLDAVSHSRHCVLFEELRFYAYSIVNREREKGSFHSFNRLLEAYAHNHNNFKRRGFPANLTAAQVKATVKSVARWTWDRYTGSSRCHRGVMALDPALTIQERQRLAAQRTHKVRQKSTESRIRAAANQLLQKDEKLTLTAVATVANLTRQTVAKYAHVIEAIKAEPAKVISLEAEAAKRKNVNYAQHQITAAMLKEGQTRKEPGAGSESLNYLKLALLQLVRTPPPD